MAVVLKYDSPTCFLWIDARVCGSASVLVSVVHVRAPYGGSGEDHLFCVVDYSIGPTIAGHAHGTRDMRVAACCPRRDAGIHGIRREQHA